MALIAWNIQCQAEASLNSSIQYIGLRIFWNVVKESYNTVHTTHVHCTVCTLHWNKTSSKLVHSVQSVLLTNKSFN